eukprot:s605_g14.t1
MSRGGAKNYSKAFVDPYLLFRAVHRNQEILTNLGSYETISRSQATDARGLLHCLPLIEDLLEISPSAGLHPQPLRQAIMKLVQQSPKMNQTDWNCTVWTNMRAERVTVVLLHLRRLKSEEETRKCAAKLTGKEWQQLKDLADKLGEKDEAEDVEKRSLDKREAAKEPDAALLDKRRTLQKHESEVSMDSQGFPACLQSPAKREAFPLQDGSSPELGTTSLPKGGSFLKRRKGQAVAATSSWEPADQDPGLTKAMGLGKHLKGIQKKPAAKPPPTKKKTKGKAWDKLYVTHPKKGKERAYIQGRYGAKDKPFLIVEVTKKQSPKYKEVIDIIRRRLQEENLTKEEAVSLRGELLGWW